MPEDKDPSSRAKRGDKQAIKELLGDDKPAGQGHSTVQTDEVPDSTDPVQIDNDVHPGEVNNSGVTNPDASMAVGGNPN